MKAKDFLISDEGDLQIEDGDFLVGESDLQHMDHLLISAPGEWKQWPLVGANLRMDINAPLTGEALNRITRKVQLQLEMDGYVIGKMNFRSLEDFSIEAERKQ